MSGTVLIVDDDPYIREALSDLLTDEGYSVLMAREGAEGLAVLAQHRPCVIVLDIMMPVMDGLTFLRHMEAMVPFRNTPVIVMTAAPGRLPAAMGVPVITKPIEIHALLEMIRRHCSPETPERDDLGRGEADRPEPAGAKGSSEAQDPGTDAAGVTRAQRSPVTRLS